METWGAFVVVHEIVNVLSADGSNYASQFLVDQRGSGDFHPNLAVGPLWRVRATCSPLDRTLGNAFAQ